MHNYRVRSLVLAGMLLSAIGAAGADPSQAERLRFGEQVSGFLMDVVRGLPATLGFLISKGGITSNDVLSSGLKLRTARAAVREMHRQVGSLVMDEHSLAKRGLLVRHLVMPGMLEETRQIVGNYAAKNPHPITQRVDFL